MEPFLCLIDPFLSLLKVLIYGPSRDPSSGPLCIPKIRHILLSGDAARVKLPITLRARFLGPYQLDRTGYRTELIRKLPEPWRCSLSDTEPKLSRALSWLT
jgi:hypothetical protein